MDNRNTVQDTWNVSQLCRSSIVVLLTPAYWWTLLDKGPTRVYLCHFLQSFMSRAEKCCQEKRGRSWIVLGVSLPKHTSGERGNVHEHENTTPGPTEHTAIGRVGTGAGTCLFQLGHVWFFIFLKKSSSPQCPCEDLGQSQVPEGFFWHWSGHLGLHISYCIPFVMCTIFGFVSHCPDLNNPCLFYLHCK